MAAQPDVQTFSFVQIDRTLTRLFPAKACSQEMQPTALSTLSGRGPIPLSCPRLWEFS